MGYASKFGRAKINSRNPQAFAICDRCGFGYNHVDLRFQMDYAGSALINKRILVCNRCYDQPNEQLRALIFPADPMPIVNPRPANFKVAESNTRYTSAPPTTGGRTGIPVPGGDPRGLQDGDKRVVQQTGEPPGGLNETPGVPYDNDSIPQTGPLK